MARIRFSRAEDYVRGDLIVQIYVDGEKALSLVGPACQDLELAAGTHMVQARMFGRKGPVIALDVQDRDLNVAVSGTRQGMKNYWIMTVCLSCCYTLRGKLGWLFWGLTALVFAFGVYRYRKLSPQMLRLSVSGDIISGTPAFSKPLSSPR